MSDSGHNKLDDRLEFAVEIARAAGELTLQHFRRRSLRVERKSDDSPVTIADRQAEQFLRDQIAERFPGDGIVGEEFAESPGSTSYQWVLDPIDGTKSFIHGVPLYTTLISVLDGDQACLGVIHAPACGETVYAAIGKGCWYQDERDEGGHAQRAQVSSVGQLHEALFLTSEVVSFSRSRSQDAMDVYLQIQQVARLSRTWGDGYGYLMVATGRADVMIDPVVNLWDVAAVQPIIQEAGGKFTDWQGRPTVRSRDAIGTNGLLAEQILAFTRNQRTPVADRPRI